MAEFEYEVEDRFRPRALSPEAELMAVNVREAAADLALLIVAATEPGREQDLALTNLEQATMWAVAAIARS